MLETWKWWIGLIVPSTIALITGFKAEIGNQFAGWWNALTPWRFLFWGSLLWLAVVLSGRYLRWASGRLETRLSAIEKALDQEVKDRYHGEQLDAKAQTTLSQRIAELEKNR